MRIRWKTAVRRRGPTVLDDPDSDEEIPEVSLEDFPSISSGAECEKAIAHKGGKFKITRNRKKHKECPKQQLCDPHRLGHARIKIRAERLVNKRSINPYVLKIMRTSRWTNSRRQCFQSVDGCVPDERIHESKEYAGQWST